MNTLPRTLSIAVLLAASLSGCSIVRTLGLAPGHKAASREVAAAEPFPLTGIGRSQLDQGNYGLAIETFRKALLQGEAQAPALNGLGVGYAHIGRSDLAAQYFRLAIAADPQNERYGANLDLLLRSNGIDRMASRAPLAGLPAAEDETPAPAVAEARPADDVRGRLIRISSREFEIRTVAPALPAAAARGQRGVRMATRPGAGAIARIDLPRLPERGEGGQSSR